MSPTSVSKAGDQDLKSVLKDINSKFWSVSLPATAAQVSGLLGLTITLFFVAFLQDPDKTAAVGLGLSILIMMCEAPCTGMNTAISIMVSIAYGNKDYNQCNKVL